MMNKRMGVRNCGTCKYDTAHLKTLWELCGHPDSRHREFWAEDKTPGQCDHWQPHEAPKLGDPDGTDEADF